MVRGIGSSNNPVYAMAEAVVAQHLALETMGLAQLQDQFSRVAGGFNGAMIAPAGWMPPPPYASANPYETIAPLVATPYRQQFLAGIAGPHQGSFGLSPSNGSDVAGVLNDPSLTVEDKVTLMIMLIMKKMDKDIEKMSQDINKLQQQQQQGAQGGGGGKGGGKGGGGAGGGAGGDKSIDVETMKLKRLIDKRSQMFDMLRQIIDKYNQTAKGIIDSMGR
jgi:hypothetical protein